jgi:hypothetical protein
MTLHDPCPTCGRTYGTVVDVPDRCGCCLTGLSLDGRPVHPVRRADGLWISPINGAECLRLPDGTWTIYIGAELGWTREQQIERVAANRAAGVW